MTLLPLILVLITTQLPCGPREFSDYCKCKLEEAEQASSDAPEPPDCKGQKHHIISRPIARALKQHPTLKGLYKARDPRFVAQAKDEEAHCGYQRWHRDVDDEVVAWLRKTEDATPKQFEACLREIYSRPEMRARFPHGF